MICIHTHMKRIQKEEICLDCKKFFREWKWHTCTKSHYEDPCLICEEYIQRFDTELGRSIML